ncbi:MAG: PorT family protein [Bacteroidales bacterium]|nr:PorT family protein [Bacteroidales bacterium]
MKKTIITLIAIILVINANAQKFGVKLGVNMSGINSSTQLQDIQTAALGTGLQGGFVFEFMPAKIGIRAEALYTQKGYNVETAISNDSTDIITDFSLNLNYIEVPVLLKIKMGPAYLVAGPYFGYAMSGEEIITMTVDGEELVNSQIEAQGSIPSNDVFKSGEFNGDNIKFSRTDFGLNAGLGVKFLKFFAEARYGVGLANIQNYDNMPADEFTKNYTITFSLGMFFN